MSCSIYEQLNVDNTGEWLKHVRTILNQLTPELQNEITNIMSTLLTASPALQSCIMKAVTFDVQEKFDTIKLNTLINNTCEQLLKDQEGEKETVLVSSAVFEPVKSKVNKDLLSCSHGNSVCIHHFASSRGCDLNEGCRFCHEEHPDKEQSELSLQAKLEYAKRGRHDKPESNKIMVISKPVPFSIEPPLPEPIYDSGLVPAGSEKTITVSAFIDYLKQISFAIVFQFAVVLYSTQPNALRDAENDIRKYLFHISRHAAVIAGVAKVPIDGVSAGILLFRIAAHMESVPDTQFKTLVRQYVNFLDSISIQQSDNSVLRFEHSKHIFNKMDIIFFPGGFTFPLTLKEIQHNYKTKGPSTSPKENIQSEVNTIDPLAKPNPTINVRELHRRKLCVACRHYLRGMCYRGDACNFCHNPEHQAEYERSTSNERLQEKK